MNGSFAEHKQDDGARTFNGGRYRYRGRRNPVPANTTHGKSEVKHTASSVRAPSTAPAHGTTKTSTTDALAHHIADLSTQLQTERLQHAQTRSLLTEQDKLKKTHMNKAGTVKALDMRADGWYERNEMHLLCMHILWQHTQHAQTGVPRAQRDRLYNTLVYLHKAWKRRYSDNPAYLAEDLQMTLAVATNTNGFSDAQWERLQSMQYELAAALERQYQTELADGQKEHAPPATAETVKTTSVPAVTKTPSVPAGSATIVTPITASRANGTAMQHATIVTPVTTSRTATHVAAAHEKEDDDVDADESGEPDDRE